MIKITSHVLDTSSGKPAEGISIELFYLSDNEWKKTGEGITNKDGRCGELLAQTGKAKKGNYKLKFNTGDYFSKKEIMRFHPEVEIAFEVSEEEHYHIPLLLSPFGYTTYRGS